MNKKDAMGVLGPFRDERSVMDQKMQTEFGKYGKPYLEFYLNGKLNPRDEAIGVLGPAGNNRSNMDRLMQAEFNPSRDPNYIDSIESLSAFRTCPRGCGKNCGCGCMSGKRCTCINCPANVENYRGIASTRDNPDNPLNNYAKYVPL